MTLHAMALVGTLTPSVQPSSSETIAHATTVLARNAATWQGNPYPRRRSRSDVRNVFPIDDRVIGDEYGH